MFDDTYADFGSLAASLSDGNSASETSDTTAASHVPITTIES